MSLKSGHRIFPVFGKEQDKQVKDFTAHSVGTIRLQPDGWFLTTPFIEFADKIYNFEYKETDVLVMAYPKCGSNWTQEIIWTLRNNPDLNNPLGKLPISVRCPHLEVDFIMKGHNMTLLDDSNDAYVRFKQKYPERNPDDSFFLQLAQLSPDPRTFKTHLPFSLVNQKNLDACKVVYVVREPKDVAVSYHHNSRIFKAHGYVGNFDSFINYFVNDTLLFGPFWKSVKEAWINRSHPNLHFMYYEDMKENPKREITRLQNFLGLKLNDSQINNVVEYTSFPEMKKRDHLMREASKSKTKSEKYMVLNVVKEEGGFFRKGICGDWKNKLTEEQANKIDEWTRKNVDADFGPDFKYSLNV